MELKTTEEIVQRMLEKNKLTRTDDFILYGAVLKKLGIDLQTSLYDFLANAKKNKVPTFETVTRCRRHIQEIRPELKEKEIAELRHFAEYDFIKYNDTGIGGHYA